MTDDGANVCNFFKKPSQNKNIRKRSTTESADDDDQGDQEFKTSFLSHRPKKPLASDKALHFSSASSSSKLSGNDSAAEAEIEAGVFQFESSKEIQVHNDSRATASLQTETQFDRDARAIRERVLKQAEKSLKGGAASGSDSGNEKIYRGIHGYTDFKAGFRREQTVAGEKAGGAHGPLRASAHIRTSVRFDYQPDICKDYKETGYCGFGDACKFMHDRGDYKSGWQLEKEWEERQKARKRDLAMGGGGDDGGGGSDEDDSDGTELPFACFICRRPFEDPVVTKCRHYFCEHCALKMTSDSGQDQSLSRRITHTYKKKKATLGTTTTTAASTATLPVTSATPPATIATPPGTTAPPSTAPPSTAPPYHSSDHQHTPYYPYPPPYYPQSYYPYPPPHPQPPYPQLPYPQPHYTQPPYPQPRYSQPPPPPPPFEALVRMSACPLSLRANNKYFDLVINKLRA